jgi:hypothetical protein
MKGLKRLFTVLPWCLFGGLLFFLVLPSVVFAYDSSSNDFKEYIRLLERQNALYGWKDLNPEKYHGNITGQQKTSTRLCLLLSVIARETAFCF